MIGPLIERVTNEIALAFVALMHSSFADDLNFTVNRPEVENESTEHRQRETHEPVKHGDPEVQ